MPVERVPGFWDYLSQGVDKGVQLGMEGVKGRREEDRMKVQDAQSNATMMAQLFQSGAVGNTELQGALQGVGIQAPVMKSKAQQRQEALAGGQTAIDALPDERKKDLGFTTTLQKKQESAAGATADMETTKAQGLAKYLGGEKLSDQEYAAYGLPSPADRELKKLTGMDPYLDQLGGRYVAGVMVKNGGRLKPGAADQAAEQAYADYVAERGQNGMGGLTPEQVMYTRSYFNRATQDALIAQQKLDIAKYESESGRIHANAAGAASGQNTNIKWFGQMNNAMESLRKAQGDLMKANPALGVALDNPQLASNPMVAGAVAKYNELSQTMEAFRGAQGALANGQVPGNLSALLEASTHITSQGAGGVPGASAPGNVGGGGAAAGAGGQAASSNAADPVTTNAQAIISGRASMGQLDNAVMVGQVTQAQAAAIKAKVAELQRTKAMTVPRAARDGSDTTRKK